MDSIFSRLITEDALQDLKINQLSPAISNARVIGKVLKKWTCNSPKSDLCISMLIRDQEDTILVSVWNHQLIEKAKQVQVNQYISIEFPDIRFRKPNQNRLPTSCEYEIHINDKEISSINTYSRIPNFSVVPNIGDFSSLLNDDISAIKDVLITENIGKIFNILFVLVDIGPRRLVSTQFGNKTIQQNLKIWDSSLADNSFATLTIWTEDSYAFDNYSQGDIMFCERIKIDQIRNQKMIKFSSLFHSIFHHNPTCYQSSQLRECWTIHQRGLLEDKIDHFEVSKSAHFNRQKKRNHQTQPRKCLQKSLLITDFFNKIDAECKTNENKIFESSNFESICDASSAIKKQDQKTSYNKDSFLDPSMLENGSNQNFSVCSNQIDRKLKLNDMPSKSPATSFSVQDLFEMKNGQSSWAAAVLDRIESVTFRGFVINNCYACRKSRSSCTCRSDTQSYYWQYNLKMTWKDHTGELTINVTDDLATSIFGTGAHSFASLDDDVRNELMQNLIGELFILYTTKVDGSLRIDRYSIVPFSTEE